MTDAEAVEDGESIGESRGIGGGGTGADHGRVVADNVGKEVSVDGDGGEELGEAAALELFKVFPHGIECVDGGSGAKKSASEFGEVAEGDAGDGKREEGGGAAGEKEGEAGVGRVVCPEAFHVFEEVGGRGSVALGWDRVIGLAEPGTRDRGHTDGSAGWDDGEGGGLGFGVKGEKAFEHGKGSLADGDGAQDWVGRGLGAEGAGDGGGGVGGAEDRVDDGTGVAAVVFEAGRRPENRCWQRRHPVSPAGRAGHGPSSLGMLAAAAG